MARPHPCSHYSFSSFVFGRQGAYYTQPVYAAQPHVIHHTTVVQPNSIPSTALYPAPVPVPAPRNNGMHTMGMVAGTTMAMSAGGTSIHSLVFEENETLKRSNAAPCKAIHSYQLFHISLLVFLFLFFTYKNLKFGIKLCSACLILNYLDPAFTDTAAASLLRYVSISF